jgi:hypothetical protein
VDGPLGIMLMRPRITEVGEQAVAHVFGDVTVEPLYNIRAASLVFADDFAQVLGIEASRER